MASSSHAAASVMVVDDDPAVRKVLTGLLVQAGYQASGLSDAASALATYAREEFDAVISDVKMPGMDGLEFLKRLRRSDSSAVVVMLTAHATVPLAVEAMRLGATDFLTKPFDRDEVLFTLDKAIRNAAYGAQNPPTRGVSNRVITASPAMKEVGALLQRAAKGQATVLLCGESGTGKEIAARQLHEMSPRREAPFVSVHGAALPENLLESELFGYEQGAFTGAVRRKPGRVELAEGGTLFFDEIGDISPTVQVKLLRLLQEKEFQRLGATETLKCDVRFVAATHRDLGAMVEKGDFREDLFYRLNVIPIMIPPLRERPRDIAPLANHFVTELGAANGRSSLRFSETALRRLTQEPWKGNVRELENFVERLTVFVGTELIDLEDVERELARDPFRTPSRRRGSSSENLPGSDLEATRADAEREAIIEAIRRADGNRSKAARLLGVSRRTLYNKLSELRITDP